MGKPKVCSFRQQARQAWTEAASALAIGLCAGRRCARRSPLLAFACLRRAEMVVIRGRHSPSRERVYLTHGPGVEELLRGLRGVTNRTAT